jgi:hypothetical protein
VVIQDLKLVVTIRQAEVIMYQDLHQIVLDHPQFLDPTQALDHLQILVEDHLQILVEDHLQVDLFQEERDK